MTRTWPSSTSTDPTGTRPGPDRRRRTGAERLVLCVVSASLFALIAGCDEPDPGADVVRQVREAEYSLSYRGSKRIAYGSRYEKTWEFLVTHFAGENGEVGPTVTETVGRDTGRARTRVDWRSRHDYWLGNAERLLANYRIQADGPAEVAGREGTRYVVRSRHEGRARPSLEVVVDGETGLLLSYRERNWRGEPAILVEFTSLVVRPTDLPPRPERPPEPDAAAEAEEAPAPLPFRRLEPRWLPEGFGAKGEGRRWGRTRRGWKNVYSDGLSWFEIRQWAAKEGEEPGIVRRNVKGSHVTLRMTYEGVAVALYGRLDPEELEKVLESLAVAD